MESKAKKLKLECDDEDEVIKEFPVYHSTRLQKNLYSFCFPLLPKDCNNEFSIRRGHFRPNNQEIELEMEINVESPNFDSDRAELIAQDIIKEVKNKKSVYFENGLVDKVYLKSTKIVNEPHKFAAMVFNGHEVHLTTLKNMFHFRPTFPYLDNKKKSKDCFHSNVSDDENDEEDSKANDNKVQAVTVRFKQSDDRWKKNKKIKSEDVKNEEEKWIECKFEEESSSFSQLEKLKLLAENTQETGQALNLTSQEYLKVLVPEHQEMVKDEPGLPSHIMSLHALRALPIAEQCQLLLKDAQIIQFQQLLMILAGNEGLTADILLKTLPKVAVLVRGNWIVKSEVLYPNNTLSAISGVPAELMCRARDYVLYLFKKNQYVERKRVSSVMKIPSEEVKEIFTGFSKLRHNKGWELMLEPDMDFIVKHNDIAQKQNEFWEKRFKQISEFFKDNISNTTKIQRRKSKSISEDTKRNQFSSDNDSGTEKKSPISSRKNKKTKCDE